MIRIVSAVILGLALTGVIHIAALQLVPMLTPRLARDRLATLGPELQFHPLSPAMAGPDYDPAFRYAACLFNLSEGPVAIDAPPGGDYWGVSFHDRRGGVFFAVNNRSAEQGRGVTLVVAPGAQAGRLSRLLQERNDSSVVVPSGDARRGYALMRVIAMTPSRAGEAADRLTRTRCRKFEPPPPPPPPAEAAAPPPPPAPTERRTRRQ